MPGSDRKVGGRLLRLYQGMVWGPILLNIFFFVTLAQKVERVNEIALCYRHEVVRHIDKRKIKILCKKNWMTLKIMQ